MLKSRHAQRRKAGRKDVKGFRIVVGVQRDKAWLGIESSILTVRPTLYLPS
jgi:hypothetical protein